MSGRDSVVISPSSREPLTALPTESTCPQVRRESMTETSQRSLLLLLRCLPRLTSPGSGQLLAKARPLLSAPCNAGSHVTSSPSSGDDFHRDFGWHRSTRSW